MFLMSNGDKSGFAWYIKAATPAAFPLTPEKYRWEDKLGGVRTEVLAFAGNANDQATANRQSGVASGGGFGGAPGGRGGQLVDASRARMPVDDNIDKNGWDNYAGSESNPPKYSLWH